MPDTIALHVSWRWRSGAYLVFRIVAFDIPWMGSDPLLSHLLIPHSIAGSVLEIDRVGTAFAFQAFFPIFRMCLITPANESRREVRDQPCLPQAAILQRKLCFLSVSGSIPRKKVQSLGCFPPLHPLHKTRNFVSNEKVVKDFLQLFCSINACQRNKWETIIQCVSQ